jgi:prevent-host-death family protein
MKIVTIHEAKTHLSKIIQEVRNGEDIVIAHGREPVVRLVLVESARAQPQIGWARGQVTMAADFEAPLTDFSEYE